jgi:hypothetical protein
MSSFYVVGYKEPSLPMHGPNTLGPYNDVKTNLLEYVFPFSSDALINFILSSV